MSYPSHKVPATVDVGEKFGIAYYSPDGTNIEVWINKTTKVGAMRWSPKAIHDTRTFAYRFRAAGSYTIDLKIDGSPSWYTMNVTAA